MKSANLGTMARARSFEVIVAGAGIAGVSLAYFLTERGLGDVLVLEREEALARHSTGRSAATLSEIDANPTLLRLKIQSAPFFREPPPGFSENPLLNSTGVLAVFPEPQWSAMRALAPALVEAGLKFEVLDTPAALDRVPVLARGAVAGALLMSGDGRLDVHEILSSYLRHACRNGVELRLGEEAEEIIVEGGRCRGVRTPRGEYHARVVVDAGGAWAGNIARRAGASAIRLVPHRRTIVIFPPPSGMDVVGWPIVASDTHSLYFAPEAGEVLLSPMDEEPTEPCDAHPDDLVIAQGIERLRSLAPALVPRAIHRKWAGLRTFAPDRVHVVGEDPRLPGFFWLAGQGGCGIETSPLIGSIAADLITRGVTERFDAALLAPGRFG